MFPESLAPFFSLDEFAVEGLLDGTAVRGIFDQAYVAAGAGMGMSSTVPAFTLPTASVPASPVGKLLAIGSVTYAVAEHEPDGTGVSLLALERTA